MTFHSAILISVVVPVYSGENYLTELVSQLNEVKARWRAVAAPMELAEVILVDDAAIDGSPLIVDRLSAEYDFVTALHLMRNFGQHAATIAGALHSSGDWIITMDEDLQHSPFDIERLLECAVRSGADIVYAKPINAVHEARSRDWASKGFKKAIVLLTGNANVEHFNSFRLLRGSLARAASSVCGQETYFDVALSWFANRVNYLSVELKDRRFIESGRSGYSFRRLLSHARRLLVTSQVKIVRPVGLIALAIVAFTIIGAIWLFLERLFFSSGFLPAGWTSLMLAILFFGGVAIFMLTLVVEYLSVLVLATHGKPIFFAVDRSPDQCMVEYFTTRSK